MSHLSHFILHCLLLQQLSGLPQLHRSRSTRSRLDVKAASATADASGVVPGEKKFLGIAYFTWAKILPLGLMFFCILFNYTILRDTKVHLTASCMCFELRAFMAVQYV